MGSSISRVTSRIRLVVTYIKGLLAPLTAIHEPKMLRDACEAWSLKPYILS